MKPIIFSTEMVKAILEGRKTQTRRVIKPQPPLSRLVDYTFESDDGKIVAHGHPYPRPCATLKPKYEVGDILWVRETFFHEPCLPACAARSIIGGLPVDLPTRQLVAWIQPATSMNGVDFLKSGRFNMKTKEEIQAKIEEVAIAGVTQGNRGEFTDMYYWTGQLNALKWVLGETNDST